MPFIFENVFSMSYHLHVSSYFAKEAKRLNKRIGKKKRATGAFATKLQKPFRNFATEIEKGTECSWLYRTKSIAKLWKK